MNAELRARTLTGNIDDEMRRQDVEEGEFKNEHPDTVIAQLNLTLNDLRELAQLADKIAYRRGLCAIAGRAARALEYEYAKELNKAGISSLGYEIP